MKKSTNRKNENDFIPSNYTELYTYYIRGKGDGSSLCDKLIRYYLPYGTQDEKESLQHDIYLRCQDKKILEIFDASKANFGGAIFFVARSVCVNYLSRKSRNPLTGLNGGTLYEGDLEDGEFEPGMYSLDRIFASDDVDPDSAIDAKVLVRKVMDWAESLAAAPRNKRDSSIKGLLNLMLEESDPKECAAALGVTTSTIMNWLIYIRENVKRMQTATV